MWICLIFWQFRYESYPQVVLLKVFIAPPICNALAVDSFWWLVEKMAAQLIEQSSHVVI